MHIEFTLPTGAGGQAAGHYSYMLKRKINEWCETKNTTAVMYVKPYKLCVEFADEYYYVLFALEWQVGNRWQEFTIQAQ